MRKNEELSNLKSCLNKSKNDEMLFVLLERDRAFPSTVRFWIQERVRLGLNKPGDPQLVSAEADAKAVEEAYKGV